MTNHYHLLVETPEANLVAGMRWFQTTYTVRFNRRHRLSGHLFQGRYKAVIVDPEEREYFVTLSDYIHLNPVRAGMISLAERLFDYRWSSYRWYAAKGGRAAWFEAGRVLGDLGFEDTTAGRNLYAERMRDRAVNERATGNAARNEQLRRGWCLGGASFRERVLGLLEKSGEKFSKKKEIEGSVRRNHDANEARRVLVEAMSCLGLKEVELMQLRRSDARKLAIARVIRSRTSVPNQWIVRGLCLGHVSNVSRYCSPTAAKGIADDKLNDWFADKK